MVVESSVFLIVQYKNHHHEPTTTRNKTMGNNHRV